MKIAVQAVGTAIAEEGKRRRRTHEKSRRGCRNCKLRRVKCDETRPKCTKCTSYGVKCNFDPHIPDLQMDHDGTLALKTGPRFQVQVQGPPILPKPSSHISLGKLDVPEFLYPAIDADLHLDREFLDRFTRFQTRTVLSVGTPNTAVMFQNVASELSFSHPYLMHSAQVLTAIHDRYLSTLPLSLSSRRTTAEIYHLTRAASLFNQKLSEPIEHHDRDPLWATAALLGIIAFASIDAATPEEAWPLKPPGPNDFEWISMSEHKLAVWHVTDPSRPDSAFHDLATEHAKLFQNVPPAPVSGIQGIPPEFIDLYELSPSSTPENSPYYVAVCLMTSLMLIDCDRINVIRFLALVSHMQPKFKSLVHEKDPRALLLLAYWYAKVGGAVWWLERRTLLEGQATCIYLERYHPEEAAIHELLRFPKMKLGLVGEYDANLDLYTPVEKAKTTEETRSSQSLEYAHAPDKLASLINTSASQQNITPTTRSSIWQPGPIAFYIASGGITTNNPPT